MAENDGHPAEHQPGATGPAATDSPGQQQSPPVEDAAHGGAPLAPPGSATPKITRKRAGAFLAVAVVALTLGIVLYLANAPSVMSIDIEVGGSALNWPLPPGIDRALWWDFVLISGYGLALLLATTVATRLFWSERARPRHNSRSPTTRSRGWTKSAPSPCSTRTGTRRRRLPIVSALPI
jgi:hypothetical protein